MTAAAIARPGRRVVGPDPAVQPAEEAAVAVARRAELLALLAGVVARPLGRPVALRARPVERLARLVAPQARPVERLGRPVAPRARREAEVVRQVPGRAEPPGARREVRPAWVAAQPSVFPPWTSREAGIPAPSSVCSASVRVYPL